MQRTITRTIQSWLFFTISVEWEGEAFSHYAWTLGDAVDWMAQYPANARCRVSDRLSGGWIIARG